MSRQGFWSRIREARFARAVLVYLAAAFVVLQVSNELREALGLPQWVTVTVVLMLAVGLVVVALTAWVHTQLRAGDAPVREVQAGAWQLDLPDVGRSLRRGRFPRLTWPRTILGGVLVFAVLVGVVVAITIVARRPPPTASGSADAAPALAVLPFATNSDELEIWREGMIEALSTSVDFGELRSVSSRTVLARWREQVSPDATPDLPKTLEIAKSTGARWALVGSVLEMGRTLRLVGTLYEVESGEQVGRQQIDTSPEDMVAAVEQFAVDIIGILVGSSGRLAGNPSLTTTSLPAFRAYLRGAAHHRAGRLDDAVAAYEEAIRVDSTFALAWLRLSEAHGWWTALLGSSSTQAAERAAQMLDRLPPRDALLARGRMALINGRRDGLELGREAVARYPDDALAWHSLGDFLLHWGDRQLADPAEALHALDEAVRLDPSFGPYYYHLIELVLANGDSARAAALIQQAGEHLGPRAESIRLAFDLIAGDPAHRAAALAALDSTEVIRLLTAHFYVPASVPLSPRYLEAKEAVYLAAVRREASLAQLATAIFTLVQRGRVEAARDVIREHPRFGTTTNAIVFHTAMRATPGVPIEGVEDALSPTDTLALSRNLLAGAYAADHARWSDFDSARATLQRSVENANPGDTAAVRIRTGFLRALEAYGNWRRGEANDPLRAFEAAHAMMDIGTTWPYEAPVRWWIGELLATSGRSEEAIRYFRSFAGEPIGQLVLGRLHEERGDIEAARQAYSLAAEAWRDADQGFPPLEEAKQALVRLGREGGT